MKRLVSLLVTAVVLMAGSSVVGAKTLKFATLAPAGTAWMKEMKAGAKVIKERTSGRVKLKFYPGGVMGNDQSVRRKIKAGQLHGGAFTASSLASVYPGVQILSMPMIFQSLEEVDHVRETVEPLIKQGMEEKGYVILGFTEGGFARFMSKDPKPDIDSFRDGKVWIPEGDDLTPETLGELGISPVPLPISDVFTGLQTGLIDTVAVTPSASIALQWHTNTGYLTDTPVLYIIGFLAVQKKTFERLKPEDQVAVKEEMGKVYKKLDSMNRKDNQAALAALRQQGINFVDVNADEVARWRKVALDSLDNMVNDGKLPADIYRTMIDSLQQFRNRQ